MKFNCKNVFLTPGNTDLVATQNIQENQVLCVPIAHGEGRFYCDTVTLKSIEDNGQVFFRYCDENGNVTNESNPNGSINNIAGICNAGKNVFGMMPHPERCATDYLLNTDGKLVFDSFILGAGVVA